MFWQSIVNMLRVVTVLCLATAVLATPLQGVPRLDGRIVGGEDAPIDDYPYQLALLIAGNQECGAIIIGDLWALTAAQCVGGSTLGMRLRAGTADRIDEDAEGTIHTIFKKIVHPNFNITTVDSDIALLQVNEPFKLDKVTLKIVSLDGTPPADGATVFTAGWGNTHSGGLPSPTLQAVEVVLYAAKDCEEAYAPAAITANMTCAGKPEGGADACQGDSGGPLVVKAATPEENDLLVGIVSWGRGCALAGYPGVYTKISAFRDWIRIESGI